MLGTMTRRLHRLLGLSLVLPLVLWMATGHPSKNPPPSSLTLSKNSSLDLSFSGANTVTIDRLTGEIVQTGALNDWIDFTYRVHYMQWTPWESANVALVLAAVPLVFGLALSGLRMALGLAERGRTET